MSGGNPTVRSFKSETEAHLARSKLASMGIEATVHRFSRYRAVASGGYLLKVRPSDLSRARGILKKLDRDVDMDEYVSSDDESYARCPQCHSVNVTVEPLSGKLLALTVLFAGIPLFFLKRDRRCRKCGHTWME